MPEEEPSVPGAGPVDGEALHVVGAAIVERGRVFLARRGPSMSMPGCWEFPGGKVERGETPERALRRELREELGVEIELTAYLGRGESAGTGRRIVLDVWLARHDGSPLRSNEHDATGWFAASELSALRWPAADLPLLPRLAAALAAHGVAR